MTEKLATRRELLQLVHRVDRLYAGAARHGHSHNGEDEDAILAEDVEFTPAGGLAADDVQEALEELDTEKAPLVHGHAATEITNTPAGGISATNVQTALNELDTEKLNASDYTAADVLAKLLTVDGTGSGLDADLLDGNSSAYFLPASSYTAADVLSKLLTVDGSGSGLDADLLDGNSSAYFLPAGSYTAADVLSKLLTVDGSGSGLDADLLDGQSSAAFAAVSHTHVTGDITALDEFISDTVGAMVSGNTETNITVTYQDSDNTLDFAVTDPPTFTAITISGTAPIVTLTDTDTGGDTTLSASNTTGSLTVAIDANNEVSSSQFSMSIDGTTVMTLGNSASMNLVSPTPQYSLTDSDDSSDSRVRYASPALIIDADFNNETASTTLDFKIDGTLLGQFVAGGPLRALGLGISTAQSATISGGVLTVDRCGHIIVDTESAAATDDLDTLTVSNVSNGDIVVLRSSNAARDPTAKDGTGNMILAGDFTFTNPGDSLTLMMYLSNWRELARSDNA